MARGGHLERLQIAARSLQGAPRPGTICSTGYGITCRLLRGQGTVFHRLVLEFQFFAYMQQSRHRETHIRLASLDLVLYLSIAVRSSNGSIISIKTPSTALF